MLLSVLKALEVLSPLEAQRAGILTEVSVDSLGPSRQMAVSTSNYAMTLPSIVLHIHYLLNTLALDGIYFEVMAASVNKP